MTDAKAAWDTVLAILKRGNDAQIQRNKDRLVVIEVKKEIKYSGRGEEEAPAAPQEYSGGSI